MMAVVMLRSTRDDTGACDTSAYVMVGGTEAAHSKVVREMRPLLTLPDEKCGPAPAAAPQDGWTEREVWPFAHTIDGCEREQGWAQPGSPSGPKEGW
jgi:hypothetical protein